MPRNTTLYKIAGTKNFRLASAKVFGIYGHNLQNSSERILRLHVPDTGKVFIQVDQAGAEALIVAYLCQAGKFRNLFLHGIKPHVFVALHLFSDIWKAKLPDINIDKFLASDIAGLKKVRLDWLKIDSLIKDSDKWPANQRYYFIAKMVCHASNYDMKAPTFALNTLDKSRGSIALTTKEAGKFLDMYHELFPEIRQWHYYTVQQIYNTRTLTNLFGHPRVFTSAMSDELKRDAYAFVPQSTVGSITNIACKGFQEHIENIKLASWDLLNNKHDSMLVQCPIDDAATCAKLCKAIMEQDLISPRGEAFKMRAEVSMGMNWGKKTKDNPEGMAEI